jgi:hypothetical protein
MSCQVLPQVAHGPWGLGIVVFLASALCDVVSFPGNESDLLNLAPQADAPTEYTLDRVELCPNKSTSTHGDLLTVKSKQLIICKVELKA